MIWNTVPEAEAYDIYRGTTDNSDTATKITTNVGSMNNLFDDTSATQGRIYYYWVRSKKYDPLVISDLSNSDSGYRAQVMGSLTVTIYPSEVRATARWRLTSGPDTGWKQSSSTISNIPTGNYTLQFSDVYGWKKPYDRAIAIAEGSNAESGTYIPPNPDLSGDGYVNFIDFAILARRWLDTCVDPDWCESADLDWSGKVDFQDVNTLADHWLEPSSAFPRVFQPPTVVPGLEGYTLRASDITQDGSLMLLTIWDGAHRLYYTTWNPASEMWNAPQDMGFNNWDGMASLSPDEGTMYYSNHGVLYKATGSPPASPPGTLISQPTGTERPYFNGDRLYFHRGPENHDIWYCEYNSGSGEFGPCLLLSEISTFNWNEIHPYVTANGQTLLFSADWPDGYNGLDNYGGWDIYKASWNGLQWVDLTNLGPEINTVGDETLPFYCPCTTTLYFTRDGTLMQGAGPVSLYKWFAYRGHYYAATFVVGPWEDVQAEAFSIGANLVTINDSEENAWLTEHFGDRTRPGTAGIWIGLHKVGGEWAWVSGELITYEPPWCTWCALYDTGSHAYLHTASHSEAGTWNNNIWHDTKQSHYLNGIIEVPW